MTDYKITKTKIEDYKAMPLKRKYELALIGAEFIVSDTYDNGIYIAESYKRELYKMHILAVEMLKLTETENDLLITEAYYNALMESDVIGQLKVITAAYDDYMTFCEMLDREIENELIVKNDALMRIDAQIKQGITPEMIEEMTKNKADIVKMVEKNTKPTKSKAKSKK